MRRRQAHEAAPRHDIRCEECELMGLISGDIFPYLVNDTPPVHRWMHAGCAERFKKSRPATLLCEGKSND
jgi:hypothetical protein